MHKLDQVSFRQLESIEFEKNQRAKLQEQLQQERLQREQTEVTVNGLPKFVKNEALNFRNLRTAQEVNKTANYLKELELIRTQPQNYTVYTRNLVHTLSRQIKGVSSVLSGVDICLKNKEYLPGVWCVKHHDCQREIQMHLEKKRIVHPVVNALLCYGLSSAARISEQLGIEKTFVKVQYSGSEKAEKEEKSPAGFGIGGPF